MLDADAAAAQMAADPDATLAMLADLTAATDERLRSLARRLAGRLFLDVARRGPSRPRGTGRIEEQPYRPDAGDLDIDASLEAINEIRRGVAPAENTLRVRGWRRPGTAIVVLLDRSGSMGGRPLAVSAVTAAAVACRNPEAYAVVAFGADAVVVKSLARAKSAERVVNDVLALRGFGTTDLAGALAAGHAQLLGSRAGRRVTVLLSDCRATVEGDAVAVAAAHDELVIIAPRADPDEAAAFAGRTGARLVLVGGPGEIPAALERALE